MAYEFDAIDYVIPLLEIITILIVEEDNPVLGVAFILLLKTVTEDLLIRIMFILLVIVLGRPEF
ncbi:hypothetical protein [Halobacillus massiliensis]|uniref:hypothetical protein n=1 Tax=Halobacillus massiliensis TaxID=1926286 RepID=UPI0009E1DF8E|nr:hypothetical protein [Halobacillus massiliensis]